MRRRVDDGGQPPAELLVFDGDEHTTQAAWMTAFDAWHAAREGWAKQHGLESSYDFPLQRIGRECPFDPSTI